MTIGTLNLHLNPNKTHWRLSCVSSHKMLINGVYRKLSDLGLKVIYKTDSVVEMEIESADENVVLRLCLRLNYIGFEVW